MSNKRSQKENTSNYQIQNVEEIIKLEQRDRISMTISDRIANVITTFSGSMFYVFLHIVIFTIWIVWNSGIIGLKPFDPFPFNLLTMSVSLEAIFLSSFVLISQNKQALQADKRAKIDLQVNMIAEQENTKLISMVAEIHKHLGIHTHDGDTLIKEMKKDTNVNKLADLIDKEEEKMSKGKSNKPQSAVDISK